MRQVPQRRSAMRKAIAEFMQEVNARCVPGGAHLTTAQWRALLARIADKHGVSPDRLRRRIY